VKLPGRLPGEVILRNFACDAFEVEELDHDYEINNNGNRDEATMEVAAREMKIKCLTNYEYDSDLWWVPGFSGGMDLDLSSSFDLKVGMTTANGKAFEEAIPERAEILFCTSDTRLGIEFRGNVFQKLLDLILGPLQTLLGGFMKNLLCENIEAGGSEALTAMLKEIKKWMEPYFDGTNDASDVNRNGPQEELNAMMITTNSNESADAALADYTDISSFRLDFADFDSFLDTFRDMFEDIRDMIKDIWKKRNAADSNSRRSLFISTLLSTVFGTTLTVGLSTIIGTITKAVTDIISGIVKEFFGTPDDIVKTLLDFLLDIIRGDDNATNAPTSAPSPAPNPDSRRRVTANDEDSRWSFDLMNAIFNPEEIPIAKTDTAEFSLKRAVLSGSPVNKFVMNPAAAQTINAEIGMDEMDATIDVWFALAPVNRVKITESLTLSMPRRTLDLTLKTGLTGVSFDGSLLAAVPAVTNVVGRSQKITFADVADLTCAFFPKIQPSFLSLIVEGLIEPVVKGFFGVDADEVINSLLSQFVKLYQSVIDDVLSNFVGTTFLETFDDTLQDLLKEAEKEFRKKCESDNERKRRKTTSSGLRRSGGGGDGGVNGEWRR